MEERTYRDLFEMVPIGEEEAPMCNTAHTGCVMAATDKY